MFSYRKYLLLVVLAFSFIGLRCCPQDQVEQPYLILYAFDAEGEKLAEMISAPEELRLLGRKVIIGDLSGHRIVLAESGVGMTSAAQTTQHMIDLYDPQGLIFTGIAGAIDSSVHIGDIVINRTWATHDYGYWGAEGFQPGKLLTFNGYTDSLEQLIYIPADTTFLRITGEMSNEDFEFAKIGERMPKILTDGVGVSGNVFLDNIEKRMWMSDTFSAMTVDMESAAVAQVALANAVPFIIFRSASDLAGGSESGTAHAELEKFFQIAADNSIQVVVRFLEKL